MSNLTLTTSPAGEIAVMLAGATLASGKWGRVRAADYMPAGENDGPETGVVMRSDVGLRGDDIEILTTIKNLSETDTLPVIVLGGLTLHWPTGECPDNGRATSRHPSYFAAHGWDRMAYPSWHNPLRSVACRGPSWSVGVNILGEPEEVQSVILTQWTASRNNNERRPLVMIKRPIPPGGSWVVRIVFRFRARPDLDDLMGPWVEDFRRRHPQPLYVAQAKPMTTAWIAEIPAPDPNNPGEFRVRVDTPAGRDEFARKAFAPLADAGGQCVLVWDLSGCRWRENPKAKYWPGIAWPQVNVATLAADGGWNYGVRLGALMRLDVINAAQGPEIVPVNPADPFDVQCVIDSLDYWLSCGVRDLYLDSAAWVASQIPIVRAIRLRAIERGINLNTYLECSTAASLPWSGVYTNIYLQDDGKTFDTRPPAKAGEEPSKNIDVEEFGVFRALVPTLGAVAQLRNVPEARIPDAIAWAAARGLVAAPNYVSAPKFIGAMRQAFEGNERIDPVSRTWRW